MIKRLFVNPQEGRLRAPWRLLIFFFILIVLVIVFGLASQLLWGLTEGASGENSALLVFRGTFITLLAVVISMMIAARLLDQRPFADFGFRFSSRWWADFGFGLFLGALFMTLIFLVELAAGWVTVTDTFRSGDPSRPFLLALLPLVGVFVCIGIYEEMLSRGYLLLNLSEGLNFSFLNPTIAVTLAWLLSSAFFGVNHAFNPNSTVMSTINLVLAGLLLGLGFVLTGQLALSIGMHITWNLFQGSVFGFPVSGIDFSQTTLIATSQGGPDLWTGGAFGPEGGLISVVGMLLIAGTILVWVRVRYGTIALHTELAQPPTKKDRGPKVFPEGELH